MKKIYIEHLDIANKIENNSEKLTYLTSVLRSLLQLTVVTLFEITKNATTTYEVELDDFITSFSKPADGTPLQIINTLTPQLRTYIHNDFLSGWFEARKNIKEPISKQLIDWVEFRNNRPAHGVLDYSLIDEWSDKTQQIIQDCLLVFSNIIPEIYDKDSIRLSNKFSRLSIKSPLLIDNHAIVIRNITPQKGIWKFKGQLLSLKNAKEFTITLPDDNVFSTLNGKSGDKYVLSDIILKNGNDSIFNNIPVRQTDTFEGRKKELGLLTEWMDDEDSRYCLVYGDGGYGKTTLVLEMLNQLLESQLDFNKKLPTIISYCSAKMTKWTEEGLVHFTESAPVMDECIRELMRCFQTPLPADWYKVSDRQLINKAIGVLKEQKLTRDDVLLVIDNTETLATSPEEAKKLGVFFKAIGKQIGRIIITSRRREFIEATPIVIEGLSEAEGVSLMNMLAKEYNAKPIQQAGEARLRKLSNQLMNKPILLEALVKYIARTGSGIDMAIEKTFKKSNEDLLEFLYYDAWARMTELQKEVFLVLIHMVSPLDQISISKACQEIGIPHTEFQSGLEETHFAVLTDYGKTYSLELVELAKRFFLQQFKKLEEIKKNNLRSHANKVDSYVAEREKIEKEYKTDRVAEAFRSEYAKAAKIAVEKGDTKGALEMYELAIEDDPVNSSLFDRFSWFLLHRTNKFNYAKKMSEKAIELDKNNVNAIVGLALVCYRLGELESGDDFINEAKKSRGLSFCFLRKAIARYHKAREENDINHKIDLLELALEQLEQAERNNSRRCGYDDKNYDDIKRYEILAIRELTVSRAIRTRTKF